MDFRSIKVTSINEARAFCPTFNQRRFRWNYRCASSSSSCGFFALSSFGKWRRERSSPTLWHSDLFALLFFFFHASKFLKIVRLIFNALLILWFFFNKEFFFHEGIDNSLIYVNHIISFNYPLAVKKKYLAWGIFQFQSPSFSKT